LLEQEFLCVPTATFENGVWRQQMKDTGSCDVHYTVAAANKLNVHYNALGVAGIQVSFVFNAANKYQYFACTIEKLPENDDSLRDRIDTVLRDRVRGLMHIYGELLSILSHAQLSPVLLTFLADSPRHLCRLAQTCTLANYVCERDFLWRRMIALHFSGELPRCVAPYKLASTRLYSERQHLTRRTAAALRDDAERFSPLRVPPPNPYPGLIPPLMSDAERDLNPFAPFPGRLPNIYPNHPYARPQFGDPLADDPLNDPLRIGPPRHPRGPRADPNLDNLFRNPSTGNRNPDGYWGGPGSSGGGMFG